MFKWELELRSCLIILLCITAWSYINQEKVKQSLLLVHTRVADNNLYRNVDGMLFEREYLKLLTLSSKFKAKRQRLISSEDLQYGLNVNNESPLEIEFAFKNVKEFSDVSEIFPSERKESIERIGAKADTIDLWIPNSATFPTVDAIIAVDLEPHFVSITTGHSHTLVLKCLKNKDPRKGARFNRRAALQYNGLLPMVASLKKNGFRFPSTDIPFIWCVPSELVNLWQTSATTRTSVRGIELLSKAELQAYRRLSIAHFIATEPLLSASSMESAASLVVPITP